ncbi:hypothetical protein [Kitasatospora sp. NPDC088783]|uniref:hypothetical protein n=1 Tax=Kitasatospora sp. NPDC088783 TaxID=3364077 RepID=UPI00380616A9
MMNGNGAAPPHGGDVVHRLLLTLVGAAASAGYLSCVAGAAWYVGQRYDGGNPLWWLLPPVLVAGNVAAAARLGSSAFAGWGVRVLFAMLAAGVFFLYLHAHRDALVQPALQWVAPPCGAFAGLYGLQIGRLGAARLFWRRTGGKG